MESSVLITQFNAQKSIPGMTSCFQHIRKVLPRPPVMLSATQRKPFRNLSGKLQSWIVKKTRETWAQVSSNVSSQSTLSCEELSSPLGTHASHRANPMTRPSSRPVQRSILDYFSPPWEKKTNSQESRPGSDPSQLDTSNSSESSSSSKVGTVPSKQFLACLTEPAIRDGKLVGLPQGLQSFVTTGNTRPRAAIVASRGLPLWQVQEFCTPDLQVVLWKTEKEEIYVVSGYLDIEHQTVLPPALKQLSRKCFREKKPILVCLDSNAHSSLWGMENNARGDRLEEWLFGNSLKVLNVGSKFTFSNKRSKTIIDVSVASQGLANRIEKWQVVEDYMCSDHRLIQMYIQAQVPSRKVVYQWSKCDWSAFAKSVDNHIQTDPSAWTAQLIDQEAEKLPKTIKKALRWACPRVEVKNPVKEFKWWSSDLHEFRSAVRRSCSVYRRHSTDSNWNKLQEA